MYPFFFNPIIPFVPVRFSIPTIDKRGIYEVCTTGISETTTVDYGVNPRVWCRLPNQSIILWKVRHPASTASAALPVNVVTPTSGSSTVNGSGSTPSGSRIPVIDNKGN